MTSSDSSMKKLRQKVISKLRACSSWRVTTPAIDHINAAKAISQTARPWVKAGLEALILIAAPHGWTWGKT
ncbi:hypothetical protein MASR1M59_23960 [Melaminivora sp.]